MMKSADETVVRLPELTKLQRVRLYFPNPDPTVNFAAGHGRLMCRPAPRCKNGSPFRRNGR